MEFLEKEIDDQELFQALIKELNDNNQIVLPSAKNSCKTFDEEYVFLAKENYTSVLIPIALDFRENLKNIPNICFILKAQRPNSDWIKTELITKSKCTISYIDFRDNNEIEVFFKDIFSFVLPNSEIYIFDREISTAHKHALKGKKIKYYTFKKKSIEFYELQIDGREAKKNLGSKCKFYWTKNPRKLHERKIIFDNFLLTADNAFENIVKAEPTWLIMVELCQSTAHDWIKKCSEEFAELRM